MSQYPPGYIDGAPIVPPNTPAEFNVGRSGCETPDTISLDACFINDTAGQVFTVAVSGAPCSGKTTLALLLAAIFSNGAEEEHENAETEITFSKSGKTKKVNEARPSRRVAVLHQSDYIASGYMLIPQKRFFTTENDFQYIKLCLQNDATGIFQVEPRDFSFFRHRILSYLPFNLGESQRFEIEGPDNFCDEAVNFPAMSRDLSRVQSGKIAVYGYVIGRDDKGDDNVSETAKQAERNSQVLVEYADLIKKMREKITAAIGQRKEDAAFIFVDGSFLYQNEHDKSFTAHSNDVKLFLPATEDKSMGRCFASPEYIDHPRGSRMPGQMWKTEGFFKNVVWENHLDAHQWLVDETCYHEGVKVRPVVDAGVSFTVHWAVDTILLKLGYSVSSPQEMKCCGGGCCERGA